MKSLWCYSLFLVGLFERVSSFDFSLNERLDDWNPSESDQDRIRGWNFTVIGGFDLEVTFLGMLSVTDGDCVVTLWDVELPEQYIAQRELDCIGGQWTWGVLTPIFLKDGGKYLITLWISAGGAGYYWADAEVELRNGADWIPTSPIAWSAGAGQSGLTADVFPSSTVSSVFSSIYAVDLGFVVLDNEVVEPQQSSDEHQEESETQIQQSDHETEDEPTTIEIFWTDRDYELMIVEVGDILIFTLDTAQDLWLLPDASAFQNCNFDTGAYKLSDSLNSPHTYEVTASDAGETLFFSSRMPTNCAQGQKLPVLVLGEMSALLEQTEGWFNTSQASDRTRGWRFYVHRDDLFVTKVGAFTPRTGRCVITLWNYETEELLGQRDTNCEENVWEWFEMRDMRLMENTEYFISIWSPSDANGGSGYYFAESQSAAANNWLPTTPIEYVGGGGQSNIDEVTFPSEITTSLETSIYAVDIIYSPEDMIEEDTEPPTEIPTDRPTERPTERLTERPTEEPTESVPSEAPTTSPTTSPTEAPIVHEILWAIRDYEDMAIESGDGILFAYSNIHNVWILPDVNAFDNCDFSDAIELAGLNESPYTYDTKSADAGEILYFGCEVPGHCNAGQKVKVSVVGEKHPLEEQIFDWSSTNPVQTRTRGWRFIVHQQGLLLTQLGMFSPDTGRCVLSLWNDETQALLTQRDITCKARRWEWVDVRSTRLVEGGRYLITLWVPSGDEGGSGYYFTDSGAADAAGWLPEYPIEYVEGTGDADIEINEYPFDTTASLVTAIYSIDIGYVREGDPQLPDKPSGEVDEEEETEEQFEEEELQQEETMAPTEPPTVVEEEDEEEEEEEESDEDEQVNDGIIGCSCNDIEERLHTVENSVGSLNQRVGALQNSIDRMDDFLQTDVMNLLEEILSSSNDS